MPIIEVEHGGTMRRLEVEGDFLRLSPQDQVSAASQALGGFGQGAQGRSGTIEVEIEGIPRPVRVDAAFRALSPEAQGATVDDIRRTWDARQRPPPDTSTGSALRSGVAGMAQGFGRTIGLAGAPETGADIAGAVDAPRNYQSATGEVVEGVRNWDFGRVAQNVPRMVVEQLPDMGGTLAAGRAGAMLGAPMGPWGVAAGGLAGAGVYTFGRNLGDNAHARAANSGREAPTTADMVSALPGTAAQAALGAVGARGLGVPAPAAPLSVPVGAAGRLRVATTASAREGATEVAEDIVGQTGQTLGTDRGLDVDPAQALAAGIGGTATRGAISMPGAVVRGGAESVVMASARRMVGDMTQDEAASFVRVAEMMDRHGEAAQRVTGRAVPPDELLNGLRGELGAEVRGILRSAEHEGWIDRDQRDELREVFESALRHNRALVDGEDDGAGPLGLARIDDLQAPAQFKATLRTAFRDLDTLSVAARKKNLTGPFERLFDIAGRGAGIAAGAAIGGGYGLVHGALGAVVGNPVGARIGGTIGRAVDRAAGTQLPLALLARQRAQSVLAGADPGDTRAMIGETRRTLADGRLSARAAVGLPIDRASMSPQVAAASARAEAARTTQEALTEAPATPLTEDPSAPLASPPESPVTTSAPSVPRSRMPAGWQFGIQRFAFTERNGVVLHAGDVEAALGRLEDRGVFTTDEAAAIRASSERIPPRWQQEITAEALEAAGVDPRNPFAGQGPGGGGGTIRNPAAWQSAASSYQAAAARAVRAGLEAGDHELVELAGEFSTATQTDLPWAMRVFKASALVSAAPDPVTQARRKALLAPLLKERN
ncbi:MULTISPECIES: hypothetical protein [Roseomonadaceae]|uniref:Uncharacterized protein n=1 Tax=Falsiroseomonas oleicola TaxID=2801474 RepID=A0ABS6H8L3_9PROT|nr:hypothetical protein [Roseomonas oleicola]MBU8544784.1 hypothetical protein [Roseomonas oleicola]